MAKQRGLHQISGKIDNLVYYGQKYVNTGLIRKQNEAMSGRVKSDPEFAGTRKAGAEFGYCSQTAAQIISLIPQRASSIIYPFILPRFTRYLYKILKAQSGTVGAREFTFTEDFARNVSAFVNSMAKKRWGSAFPSLQFRYKIVAGSFTGSLYFDRLSVQAYCSANNYDGIRFSIYDEGEVSFGTPQADGTYSRSYRIDFAYRQRLSVMADTGGDVTQQYQLTGRPNRLACCLVIMEPIKLVNNVPTYPRKDRSFAFAAAVFEGLITT